MSKDCVVCGRVDTIGGCPQVGNGSDRSIIDCFSLGLQRLRSALADANTRESMLNDELTELNETVSSALAYAEQEAAGQRAEISGLTHDAVTAEAEIERLKAEHASLLESLRAWKEGVCQDCVDREPLLTAAEQRAEAAEKSAKHAVQCHDEMEAYWAAAEQRAEAAEKRNKELQWALRAIFDHMLVEYERTKSIHSGWECVGHIGGLAAKALGISEQKARAALHDEERSAPPQECPEEGCVLEADHEEPCDTDIPEAAAQGEEK